MQSINHEFTRPASPQVPYLSPLPNKNIFVQTSFDGSTPANKIIHVTNYNNNNNNNNVSPTLPPTDPMLEESSDSYLDSDNEDSGMQGNPQCGDVTNTQLSFISALNKVTSAANHNGGVKTECLDPYHIPPRFQSPTLGDDLISPQKELKNLIKEVEISTVSNHEYSPIDSPVIDKLTEEVPRIEIVEEPETTYRARYESEGCKGPIHGSSETGFPSVKIVGYVGEVLITVYVVTRDNEPHLHTATGPGSTKSSCKEIVLDDGTPAVQMILKPIDENDDMVAVFDQLSVRRVRNWEADRELRKRGIEPSSWKSKKKEAKLAFQAAIKPTNYHPGYVLTTYSRTFLCTAPSGNPEIWWASLTEGSPEGGEELGLIGKKFASGFKIRFFSKEDDGEFWEVYADVDRAKSNLNACVVKVPPYKETVLTENIVVYVEIRVGPEKEPRCSDPYPFTYLASKTNDKCDNCVQIKGLLQRVFAEKSGDVANGLSLRVQNPNVLNGGLVHIESTKIIPTSSLSNATKTLTQTQVTNYNSVANPHPAANIPPAILPLLQPYVVKTGDMVSIVGSGTRTDTTNNVGVLYVQKVAENNNIPIMFQGTKPLTINNTLNLAPQKVMLSSQPTQNINMTVPKIIVPQTLNNMPISLTNHIPLPSIVQVCSINTSAHPTMTRTAASITNLQQTQLIHVVSQGLAVSQGTDKNVTPQTIPHTHFILNGVPVQTHQFVNNNSLQVSSKTGPMISAPTYDSNLQRIQSSKVSFVNGNNPIPNLNSVVYVKTDNTPMFNHIKEEESSSGHLTFQQGCSGNTFTVDSHQVGINTSNNNNNINNNNNHLTVNKSQTTTIFASPSLMSAVCPIANQSHPIANQSHPLGCPVVMSTTQSQNTIQQVPSSVMLHPGSQTVQLAPNTGILQHDEKDMQIISNHLQNLQKEAAASSIQYKIFPGQKVSPFGSQASFVASNVTEPLYAANRSIEIVTTVNQPIQAPAVQHFDTIATQANHELNRSAELNHVEGITQFQTSDEQKLQRLQILQNIPSNSLLGQHQNPGTIQSVGEQPVIGSTNSIINNNTSFPNQNQVQDMFVVSPLLQPRSVVNTSHVSQLQQLPIQQPISLTVFNQSPMMPTASNSDVFTHQQVHNETSPTQLSANSYQPLQISHGSQESQLLHHQQIIHQSNHSISNSINHMDDITRVESHWDRRPSITDAIESNKVGFMDSTNCVKDSNPASPMVLNIEKYDTEENNFMETLQQLNNDPQEYTSMPPTPAAVTFGTSTFDTNSQQISQIDNDLVDQDEFGTSNVSVDYSDAFKSARACASSSSWPFQKTDMTDIDPNPYIQEVTMFPTSSSVQSLSISSQPGW